tara:strand:- start:62 stop:1159 length:1098 start_codon:yes stop_codon:yes gene_type:complete
MGKITLEKTKFLAKRKFLIIFLAIALIYMIGNIVSIINFKIMYTHADWKLTQYNINYFDHGFIRRGFIGTALFPLLSKYVNNIETQKFLIFWKETFLYLIYGCAFCYFILKKTANQSNKLRIYILGCSLIGPCGLLQAAYDVGRYDHLNFIILALTLFLVEYQQFRFVSILLTLSLLVHENALFYIHPLVFSLSFNKFTKVFLNSLKLFFPSIVVAILLFTFGDKQVELPEQLSVGNIWGDGVYWGYFLNLDRKPIYSIIFIIYTLLILSLIIHFYKINKLNIDVKLLSCFAPIPLFFIVSDWGRWVHFIFISVIIVLCYKISSLKSFKVDNLFYSILFILGIPLGPIGIGNAFPYLDQIAARLN